MPFFTRMAERITPFVNLNLEECKLSIGGNNLGRFVWHLHFIILYMNSFKCIILICVTSSEVGLKLGKFICTGINELQFHDIGIN